MFRRIAVVAATVTVGAQAQTPMCPNATSYAWLGNSADWGQSTNWNPTGVPGSGDAAYIPSVNTQTHFYPEVSGSDAQVCSLKMEKTGSSTPRVTVKDGSGEIRYLTINGRNGLNVGANCKLRIEKNAVLTLAEAGTVQLDGSIVFKSSLPNKRPFMFFPEGATILKGNGVLTVGSDSGEVMFRVYSDQDTTLTFESGTGSLVVQSGA